MIIQYSVFTKKLPYDGERSLFLSRRHANLDTMKAAIIAYRQYLSAVTEEEDQEKGSTKEDELEAQRSIPDWLLKH